MEQIIKFIEIYNVEITFGTLVAFIVLLILYLISEIRISGIKKKYNELVHGIEGVNIEELLIQNGYRIEQLRDDFSDLYKKVDNLDTKLTFAIQKVGFIRYNA